MVESLSCTRFSLALNIGLYHRPLYGLDHLALGPSHYYKDSNIILFYILVRRAQSSQVEVKVVLFDCYHVFCFHCPFCKVSIKFNLCHGPTECYNCMCEARRKASRSKALLLFLVTCMHDAMHAVCMLCAVWRTRDTVICGTE